MPKSVDFDEKFLCASLQIGTVPQMPWAAYKKDSNNDRIRDDAGNWELTGYCVEFVEEMSKKMNFEYELIVPTDNSEGYGRYSSFFLEQGRVSKSIYTIL